MRVEIVAFGQISEITGAALRAEGPDTTQALQQWLHAKYPALEQVRYCIAVNQQIVNSHIPLPEGAQVALLPPFSGG
jgi:molybdopterin converting factor small subunit